MNYLKYFESYKNGLIDDIKDIFMELKDEKGFNVSFIGQVNKRKSIKFIITIKKNGGIHWFVWSDIEDTIYRLLDFYYSQKPDGNIDFYNNESSYSFDKGKFAKGHKSEEDFKKDMWIGSYTRFTNIKLIVDI